MGILSWLFGRADEVLPPPPLDARATTAHQTQRQGGLAGAPEQTLSRFDVEELAAAHGVSAAAIETLASALARSQGRAAQFSHPELGGMGQWMSGGMLMIGDMFNHELKARVDRLCHAVAAAIADSPATPSRATAVEASGGSIGWWPEGLGTPASAGSQNAMRYAFFPAAKRLVIDDNGAVSIYDTGEHYLTGVSQQQSSAQTITFTDTDGAAVALSKLKRVSASIR
jgi:hypothetical protein